LVTEHLEREGGREGGAKGGRQKGGKKGKRFTSKKFISSQWSKIERERSGR
jgi:hypothetical protein